MALLKAGADPKVRNNSDELPFDYARDNEKLQGTDAYWELYQAALGQDPDTITETRLQAEQGDASAQYHLGVRYSNGEGVLKDEAEAVRWYRLSADQGNASAQNNLGVSYANGEGVLKDEAEAVRWYAPRRLLTPSVGRSDPNGLAASCPCPN